MSERPSLRRHFSWTFAIMVIALAFIAAAVFLFDRCSSMPGRIGNTTVDQMERLGRDVRNAVGQIAHMQPRVTVNDRVYFEQSTSVAELAVISQRLEVEHEFQHSWAGSVKRLRLHGTFTAKAGFDLRKEVSVNVRPEETVVRLPHAQILGLQQDSVEVLAFENGFWNSISGADVQSQHTTLAQLARRKVDERHLPADAERTFRLELAARLPANPPVHVIFYDVTAHE